MILNDKNLWVAAQRGMVSPFREQNLQGSSIDLTLGKHLKVENDNLAGPFGLTSRCLKAVTASSRVSSAWPTPSRRSPFLTIARPWCSSVAQQLGQALSTALPVGVIPGSPDSSPLSCATTCATGP